MTYLNYPGGRQTFLVGISRSSHIELSVIGVVHCICAMLCVLHCIQNVTADVGSERSSYVSVLTPFQMESLIGTVERIITSFGPWTQVIIFFKSMTSYNQEGGTCGGNGTVREVRYMTQLSDKYI